MDRRRRSPARLLAPLALVAFVLAFFAVIVGSDVSEDSDSGNGGNRQQQSANTDTETATTPDSGGPTNRFYTVQTGDTLAGIAESVGVPVERLQELNPELDPQTLVSGQKIRLRE